MSEASSLVLTEEQQLIQETTRDFVADQCSVDSLRQLREKREDAGFDRALWKQLAELGWTGIIIPEEYGGAELGLAELGVVLEELGRKLAITPLISTLVAGAGCLVRAGSDEHKAAILPAVCEGDLLLALACQETARHDPYSVSTTARKDGDGFVIDGAKTLVLDGAAADRFIVVARTSGDSGERSGLSLFLVDANETGLSRKPTFLIDSRTCADLTLSGVRVDSGALIGALGAGADILDPVLDSVAASLSAEMLGGVLDTFERTVQFLKDREQFGVKIGSFQGLKHRAARWFCEVELSKSIVLKTLRALDSNDVQAPELSAACKARLSDTFRYSGEEGIQMHGGIGVTDEEDIGFYMKRARVSELLFGDASFHRDRFASLQSF
ncbi:MAG TPA: acyl-CoA dehydrogenase [Myxococcales bacterium]|nr:acyl-CoA dehydrogenase [Myxococcales bacterium]HIK85474.1 acyl-CoA dehydrogenase [Myxococcales bacterium]